MAGALAWHAAVSHFLNIPSHCLQEIAMRQHLYVTYRFMHSLYELVRTTATRFKCSLSELLLHGAVSKVQRWCRKHQCDACSQLTYQCLPSRKIHTEVLDAWCIWRCVSLQQHNRVLCLHRNKAQRKHIPAAAVVTLHNGVTKRTVFVQLDFLQLCLDLGQRPKALST